MIRVKNRQSLKCSNALTLLLFVSYHRASLFHIFLQPHPSSITFVIYCTDYKLNLHYTTATESPMLDRVNYMRLVTFRSCSMYVCHIACSSRCVSTHLAPLFLCWPVPPLGEYSAVRKMRTNPWYVIWSPPSPFPPFPSPTFGMLLVPNHIGWYVYPYWCMWPKRVLCSGWLCITSRPTF